LRARVGAKRASCDTPLAQPPIPGARLDPIIAKSQPHRRASLKRGDGVWVGRGGNNCSNFKGPKSTVRGRHHPYRGRLPAVLMWRTPVARSAHSGLPMKYFPDEPADSVPARSAVITVPLFYLAVALIYSAYSAPWGRRQVDPESAYAMNGLVRGPHLSGGNMTCLSE
jgi:hypothetical protein